MSAPSWFCSRSLREQEQDHVKTAGLLVQVDLDLLSSWFCLSPFSFAHDQKQQLLCKLVQLLANSSEFSLPVYVRMCSKYVNAYANSISLCSINILQRTPWIASLLSPSLVSSLTLQILYTSKSCFISEDKCSDSATKNALSLWRNTWNSPNLVTWRFHRRPRCSRGLISVKKSLARDVWARTCSQRGSFSKPGVSERSGNWNRPKRAELRTRKLVINRSVDKPVAVWRRRKSSRRAVSRIIHGFIHSRTGAAALIAA